MRLVPMRFRGVTWRHNPREITFESDREVHELHAPFAGGAVQDTGRKNMLVKGEGELFGADCLQQFARLLSLFREGGSGVLAIDGVKPFHAVFQSLKIVGEPKPDILTYRFVFREVRNESDGPPAAYTAGAGENLWDVSYRFGIVIDTLVALNPQVKRPDILTEGEVIRLC